MKFYNKVFIPGIGILSDNKINSLIFLNETSDTYWKSGKNGVHCIFCLRDKKAEFVVFENKTICIVKSEMGYPAIYTLKEVFFDPPPIAVLMDLDGTSVHSENFWIWIIEKTIAKLLQKRSFSLSQDDLPYVSGHSVSEHLQYCITKYCQSVSIEKARKYYYEIASVEMKKILQGKGKQCAFLPSPYLKEFLLSLKSKKIKIGLVTSGIYEKAWPEITSAFKKIGIDNPLYFYDSIITGGYPVKAGQVGTLGELCPKPHPWLYAEIARIGLGITPSQCNKVIGIEDSGAGILSLRLAGFPTIGLQGGNITQAGADIFCNFKAKNLEDALKIILGKSQSNFTNELK